MNSKSNSIVDNNEIGIAFNLSSTANKTLTRSAKKAERAKKREGKLRLEDHLKRFPDWSL
ncbi:TraY domain-containing protein [Vibrio sp. 10N.222.54.A1]|uniref:Relaxosome protein TraY n=2 Tax=Vibrio cyclitrophicus TaxID=47951 RepID=A0A7Z1MGX5_9VIBR|nr:MULTISPECIES: TraY domain-containing protein [Vibrio]PMK82291.1 TraY domain-containing protein [Vibrio sp. 10N.261.52.E5]PMP17389.1 TraY domain-containing protein [Vibrio cyclitrophicus]PMP25760.1 TraY domain-containing protein [Vibrio cyclitrophicus]TKF84903.1 TraY domain-containing protein [Vibrio sp. F13]TKF99653.1 TraY domain-containing protein [Vibrio sp. F13]